MDQPRPSASRETLPREADPRNAVDGTGTVTARHTSLDPSRTRSQIQQRHPSVSLTAALSRAAQNHTQAAQQSHEGTRQSNFRTGQLVDGSPQQNMTTKAALSKDGRPHPKGKGSVVKQPADATKLGEQSLKDKSEEAKEPKMVDEKAEKMKRLQHEEMVRNLRSDFDSMRAMATCRVCIRLLYEPYTLACGHTFCYSCLCQWFVNNKKNKTCPDCRAKVSQLPAPAYLIREITEIFINRAEILPAGETTSQHRKWQKEESELVEKDRSSTDPATGGLFKGCFRPSRPELDLRAIRDDEDGVVRCPRCSWELEDGFCPGCALRFDDDGRVAFGGFSDMDEGSDRDFSSEELDDEIDMEDADEVLGFDTYDEFTGYSDDGSTYYQEPDHGFSANYAIQRALARGHIGPPPRRLAAHSAANGWRRSLSYSASLISDMQTSEDGEMGTLEEESEEDTEDAGSLVDFVVDDQSEEPSPARRSRTGRLVPSRESARRRLETESVSEESHIPTPDEDEYDEGGAVSNGRRRRPGNRLQTPRRISQRRPVALSISSTDNDYEEAELEEDTEALLREGWARLGRDEELIPDDDDAMTTVGWDTPTSLERDRLGGSVTPTNARPRPAIRQPSRTGIRPTTDGSRGLRRRSSVVSVVSTANYENGEAEDEDSDDDPTGMDNDGDIDMDGPPAMDLGMRHINLPRNFSNLPGGQHGPANHGGHSADVIDVESDSTSDTSIRGPRRRRPARRRQAEIDPRIRLMFAEHEEALRGASGHLDGSSLEQLEGLRTRTPNITRPRTANRRRSSQQLASLDTMIMPPAQASLSALISPQVSGSRHPRNSSATPANTLNFGSRVQSEVTGIGGVPRPQPSVLGSIGDPNNRPSASGRGSNSMILNSATTSNFDLSAGASSPTTQSLERPASRSTLGSPSGATRRAPGRELVYSPFSPPGLNFAAGQIGNPWARFVRPRQSTRTLREQSSTATLRPSSSRRLLREQPSQSSIRNGGIQSQSVRVQPSRTSLRHTPSHHRIRSQGSVRTLRSVSATPTPQASAGTITVSAPIEQRAPSAAGRRLSDEETRRRGSEVVRRRQEELAAMNNNPFSRQIANQTGRTQNFTGMIESHGLPVAFGQPSSTLSRSTSAPVSGGLAASTRGSVMDYNPVNSIGRRQSRRTINTNTAANPSSQTGGLLSGPGLNGGRSRPGAGLGSPIHGYHVDELRMNFSSPIASP